MQSKLFTFLAETFVHAGVGQEEGAIDLPVAREAATDYPYVPGSGFKGALRESARDSLPESPDDGDGDAKALDDLFGVADNAGSLLFSDLRLLLLPVRCLTSSYRWLTCPHLLERLHRDLSRAGQAPSWAPPKNPAAKTWLGPGADKEQLQLEERTFERAGELDAGLVKLLAGLIPDASARERLAAQVCLVGDSDFAWFARFGLPVQARNSLEQDTKQSQALWFEESLPPDTLLYAQIAERNDRGELAALIRLFEASPYLRIGGNETVGQGWLRLGWEGAPE